MPSGTVDPPFVEQFLATAEAVAKARPEVDLEMAREVFLEAATLLHDGLVLDDLDEHDAGAVVAGLCVDLVVLLNIRRTVRRQLGFPPDELDEYRPG